MKKKYRMGLAAVLALLFLSVGGAAHADWWSFMSRELQSVETDLFGLSPGQWTETKTWYTPPGAAQNEHGFVSNQYVDSAGDIVTLSLCDNGDQWKDMQKVCASAPNSCGAIGTGFIASRDLYDTWGNFKQHTESPCTAQTPSDSICPPKCTPQSECHADGNLYDSCTNALIKSCAAGCASNQCNIIQQCASQNVCAADGNVHDSCTGALITTCPYGCSDGKCVTASIQNGTTTQPAQCTSQNLCYADGNVHDSCTGALIQGCPNGCANNKCSDICISRNTCSSDGNLYESCSGALTKICKWGCTDNYCNALPPGTISSFSVKPSLVTIGTISTASWKVKNVTSCTVTGTNGDSWQSSGDGSFSDPTSRIVGQTNYTLQCTGLDGDAVSAAATVNIVPAFHEQ